MPDGYKIRDQTLPHFVTATVVDWIDVFTRKNYKDIVIACLNFCIANKGMVLYGYVIMSNHIHMVVQSGDGDLSGLLRDFKKFTASKILEKIKSDPESRREWLLRKFSYEAQNTGRAKNYKLWQDGFHPVMLDTLEKIEQRVKYIHYNPVEAEIVFQERDYVNSSYRNYEKDNTVFCNVNVEPLW